MSATVYVRVPGYLQNEHSEALARAGLTATWVRHDREWRGAVWAVTDPTLPEYWEGVIAVLHAVYDNGKLVGRSWERAPLPLGGVVSDADLWLVAAADRAVDAVRVLGARRYWPGRWLAAAVARCFRWWACRHAGLPSIYPGQAEGFIGVTRNPSIQIGGLGEKRPVSLCANGVVQAKITVDAEAADCLRIWAFRSFIPAEEIR